MADIHVHVHLDSVPTNISELHIHVPVVHDPDLTAKVDQVMAGVAELMAQVTQVSADVQSVLTNTSEVIKDVQRLLGQGDTQPAIDALATADSALKTANQSLLDLDAAVEAASPEPPAAEPVAEPTAEEPTA